MRFRPNIFWFIGLMIFFAYFSPQVGSHWFFVLLARVGFFVTFFCYGAGMSFGVLWRGLANWRVHLVVQLTTFVFFPFVVLFARWFFDVVFGAVVTNEIWLGIFYIAVLPSTVSSSVVMVSLAGGNIPAAIFNASISGLIGVVITPIWMSLLIVYATDAVSFSVLGAVIDLVIIIILPFGLGMIFNFAIGNWILRNKKYLRYFDQGVILLTIYTSFSKSFASNAFMGFDIMQLILLSVGLIVLFFIVYGIALICCKIMRFNQADTITVLFCGSKKSLVHGITMSNVIFAGMSSVGVLLIPLMLYHALQLLIVSIIAKHFESLSEKNKKQTTENQPTD
jgi:sodium/bile acid cotransporter 7